MPEIKLQVKRRRTNDDGYETLPEFSKKCVKLNNKSSNEFRNMGEQRAEEVGKVSCNTLVYLKGFIDSMRKKYGDN